MLAVVRTDERLLRAVATGDREAFAELYARFSRPVYALCMRIVDDRGHAEDATQEAFAAIWRGARSYDPDKGRPVAWIFAVARNAATDAARRRVARPTDHAPDEPDPGRPLDERAVASHEAFRLHVALDSLNGDERAVIELAYFGGLSQSEVAARLETPLGTVKTRTRAALRRLAVALENER